MSINGNNNINVHGDNNTINVEKEEQRPPLQKVNKRFRLIRVDAVFGFGLIFFNIYFAINYYMITLPLSLVLILVYLFYLPRKYPFMYVQVFEDHLIAYNYRKVNYGDIILFRPYNNSFDFQTETSGMTSLVLFNNNNAVYMNYLVRQYYHHIGRKIETV